MKRFLARATGIRGACASLAPGSATAQLTDDWKFPAIIHG